MSQSPSEPPKQPAPRLASVKNTAASAPSASVAAAKPASSMKFAPTLNSAPRVRGVQGPDPMAALKQAEKAVIVDGAGQASGVTSLSGAGGNASSSNTASASSAGAASAEGRGAGRGAKSSSFAPPAPARVAFQAQAPVTARASASSGGGSRGSSSNMTAEEKAQTTAAKIIAGSSSSSSGKFADDETAGPVYAKYREEAAIIREDLSKYKPINLRGDHMAFDASASPSSSVKIEQPEALEDADSFKKLRIQSAYLASSSSRPSLLPRDIAAMLPPHSEAARLFAPPATTARSAAKDSPLFFVQLPSHFPRPPVSQRASWATGEVLPGDHEDAILLLNNPTAAATSGSSSSSSSETVVNVNPSSSTVPRPYMDKLAQEMYQYEHGPNLQQMPSGYMGEMVITRDGRVKLVMGAISLDVTCGTMTPCHHETVAIETASNESVEAPPTLSQLADVGKKMVISLPLQDLEQGLGN